VIQAIYKDREFEIGTHQQSHEHWKCDYTLIRYPERTTTIHHGKEAFPTLETARAHALKHAQDAIDQAC